MMNELVDKDLNLLLVFSAVWDERNLSKAAKRLFLSQSAVSHALGRLREQFDDPLFVRSSRGVTPTDFAASIVPEVSELIHRLEGLYSSGKEFDPSKVKKTLVLSTGDYFALTLLDRLIETLAKKAPLVRVVCQPVSEIFNFSKFEHGEIHLGVTAVSIAQKEGFHTKEIFRDKISCCARKRRGTSAKVKTSLENYLKAKHIVVSNFGRDFGVVDLQLAKMKKKREVSNVVSSFYEAGRLMRKTNLVLSALDKICQNLASDYDLEVYDLPYEHETRPVTMIWHERTDKDQFYFWVRELIIEEAGRL